MRSGIYFSKDAFLGVWGRLAVAIIDVLVVVVLWVLLCFFPAGFMPDNVGVIYAVVSLFVVFGVYNVFIKRTEFGTMGYRLFGLRVIDLHGNKPSVFQMINRFTFFALGPGNAFVDLLWVTSDDSKQAIRDKWSRTYVVKKDAKPAGEAPIVIMRYGLFGLNLAFEEVSLPGGVGS